MAVLERELGRALRLLATRLVMGCAVAALVSGGSASAADPDEGERVGVLELGVAGAKSLRAGSPNWGGTVAAEFEPIEGWLEMELGVTALATARHSDLSVDLLFKKPFQLSPTAEFMVGGGPSVDRSLGGGRTIAWGAEFVVDFMFWPQRKLGWYVEPSWTIVPKTGDRSLGISAGALISF
jgi:hypothetical protein